MFSQANGPAVKEHEEWEDIFEVSPEDDIDLEPMLRTRLSCRWVLLCAGQD